jgi:hypothetical protein
MKTVKAFAPNGLGFYPSFEFTNPLILDGNFFRPNNFQLPIKVKSQRQ